MAAFNSFTGTVASIDNFGSGADPQSGCTKLYSLRGENGTQANFIAEPSTYFLDNTAIRTGDRVTGFFDANAPVPLIYPPRYRAVVIARDTPIRHVKVDRFDRRFVSSDGALRLNIGRNTRILLTNGQPFTGRLAGRDLVVVYTTTTRSIPAQTTPQQIIVLC